jgi:hypothetical protein
VVGAFVIDHVEDRLADAPGDDGPRPDADVEVDGDVAGLFEEVLLGGHPFRLECHVLCEGRLVGHLDDVDRHDLGRLGLAGVGARRGQPEEATLGLGIRDRHHDPVGTLPVGNGAGNVLFVGGSDIGSRTRRNS